MECTANPGMATLSDTMHTTLGPGRMLKAPGTGVGLAQHLSQALTQGSSPSVLEAAAGFGRCWFDPVSSQIVLSALAAQYLNVEALRHTGLDSCFIHVVSDDMLGLIAQLPHGAQCGAPKRPSRHQPGRGHALAAFGTSAA